MEPFIAQMTPPDVPAVLEISVECGLCLWSAEAYLSELIRNDSIMLTIVGRKQEIAGFAVGRIFDLGDNNFTAELTNIGVRLSEQNQGLGTHLLKSFLDECRQRCVSSVVLEVRASNVIASRFYGKFAFTPAGIRRGFYSDPFEDALTMKLHLID